MGMLVWVWTLLLTRGDGTLGNLGLSKVKNTHTDIELPQVESSKKPNPLQIKTKKVKHRYVCGRSKLV